MRNALLSVAVGLCVLVSGAVEAQGALLTARAEAGADVQVATSPATVVHATAATVPWAEAEATADFGLLRAQGFATGVIGLDGVASPVIRGDGVGSFSDVLRVHSPSHASGTPAILSVMYLVDGDVEATQSGGGIRTTASIGLQLRANQQQQQIAAADFFYAIQAASGAPGGRAEFGQDFRGNVLTSEFGILLGTDLSLEAHLQARTHVEPINVRPETLGSTGMALADLNHTFLWLGFESLTVDGVSVTDYAVSSDSGFDWSQPVPEPAGAAVAAVAAVVMVGLMRRRRRGA